MVCKYFNIIYTKWINHFISQDLKRNEEILQELKMKPLTTQVAIFLYC
jgi:hypothetical protein